jgi:hypothetical protein
MVVGSTFTGVGGVPSESGLPPSAPVTGIAAVAQGGPPAPERARGMRRTAPVVVVVVVTAVLILTGVLLLRGSSSGAGGSGDSSTFGGPVFELGTPQRTSNAEAPTFCVATAGVGDWCESLQVGSANDEITAAALTFAIRDGDEQSVNFTHGTPSIQLESSTGTSDATYSFVTGTWTAGGAVALSTGQVIVLDTGCAVSGANLCSPVPTGLLLVVQEVGAFSGQVQVTLV